MLLMTFAVAASAATATAATRAPARFSGCQRGFDGTRNNPAVGVFDIKVRVISCQMAYKYIESFPLGLTSKKTYRSYTCTRRFSPSSDDFRFLCTDGPKAYQFDAAGE